MIYQLSFINNKFFVTSCNSTDNNQTNIDPYLDEPRDNLEYIGLKKQNNIGLYLQVKNVNNNYTVFFFQLNHINFIGLYNNFADPHSTVDYKVKTEISSK